jgi:hypothetical protein
MYRIEQVRDEAARIAGSAAHVRMNDDRLAALADRLKGVPLPAWDRELHFFDGTDKSVMYTLLLDAVNFCFWPSPDYAVDYQGKRFGDDDGYCALSVAIKRAFEEGVPLWEPKTLAALSEADFRRVLRGDGEIALFDRRLAHARDVGATLIREFGGDVRNLLEASGGSAVAFAENLAERFASYADARPYRGSVVPVLKRAQLCASDLVGSFSGAGLPVLADADKLTCFADYKLPQLFHSYGVFEYASELDRAVRGLAEIPEGSEEEVEIRLCTIEAVERLRRMFADRGRQLAPREIDWLLWNESVIPGRLTVPHHRTVTVSY